MYIVVVCVCLQMKGADSYSITAADSVQVNIKHVDCIHVGSHPVFIYAHVLSSTTLASYKLLSLCQMEYWQKNCD
jgi:hypothetical protein